MSTQTDIIRALFQALVETNEAIGPFIEESIELAFRFEENIDLIQMVEPDIDEL